MEEEKQQQERMDLYGMSLIGWLGGESMWGRKTSSLFATVTVMQMPPVKTLHFINIYHRLACITTFTFPNLQNNINRLRAFFCLCSQRSYVS